MPGFNVVILHRNLAVTMNYGQIQSQIRDIQLIRIRQALFRLNAKHKMEIAKRQPNVGGNRIFSFRWLAACLGPGPNEDSRKHAF